MEGLSSACSGEMRAQRSLGGRCKCFDRLVRAAEDLFWEIQYGTVDFAFWKVRVAEIVSEEMEVAHSIVCA